MNKYAKHKHHGMIKYVKSEFPSSGNDDWRCDLNYPINIKELQATEVRSITSICYSLGRVIFPYGNRSNYDSGYFKPDVVWICNEEPLS